MSDLPKHHFVRSMTDPDKCVWAIDERTCGSYWNNYVAHFQEGNGSHRPDSWVNDLLEYGDD